MPLVSLQLERFRCIHEATLGFDSRYNLIVGANASGKTSLLEALYFLGRGRSFRTRRLDRVIQQGQPDFLAVGKVRKGWVQEGVALYCKRLPGLVITELKDSTMAKEAEAITAVLHPDERLVVLTGELRDFFDYYCSSRHI